MKLIRCLPLIVAFTPVAALAQTPAPATPAAVSTTPVADSVRAGLARYSKNMSAAADAMPADKFSFKPTPDQITFGHLTLHIAESNFRFCSAVSGLAAPEAPKLADTDPKDKLVANVKASFDFCATALAKVDDSHLADSIALFPNRSFTRAGTMFILVGSWADHYAAQSLYLRLNGVLPPTAQPASH